ncbi:MAG: DsbA family protein [Propionibacteriaceae bacterium]|nr:DsbA family protein [Propionibacteriaceae bacterium]
MTSTVTDSSTPRLEVFSDFQCPGCKGVHDVLEPVLRQAIDSGLVRVEFRTMTFLDAANSQIGSSNLRSSTRAAVAAACADFNGVYYDFYGAIYDNQPEREGDGYSDSLLRDQIPATLGLSGDALTSFQACYDNQSTGRFVRDVDEAADKDNSDGTPRLWLNGQDITEEVLTAANPANTLKQLLGL